MGAKQVSLHSMTETSRDKSSSNNQITKHTRRCADPLLTHCKYEYPLCAYINDVHLRVQEILNVLTQVKGEARHMELDADHGMLKTLNGNGLFGGIFYHTPYTPSILTHLRCTRYTVHCTLYTVHCTCTPSNKPILCQVSAMSATTTEGREGREGREGGGRSVATRKSACRSVCRSVRTAKGVSR